MKKTTLLISSILALSTILSPFLVSCGENNNNSNNTASLTKSLERIEMYTLPKTHFEYQDSFTYENAEIKLYYDDNTTNVLPVSGDMITIPPMKEENETVYITYEGHTTSYQISIELTKPEKKNPTISFTIKNGATFIYDGAGEPPLIAAYVEEDDCEYETFFEESEKNIGTQCPTKPGTYAFICQTKESDKYFSKRDYRWFIIEEKSDKLLPVITFSISNGEHFSVNNLPQIIVTLNDPTIEYSVFYTKDDGNTNLGAIAPTTPGIYAINVKTVENDTYKSAEAFRWYVID